MKKSFFLLFSIITLLVNNVKAQSNETELSSSKLATYNNGVLKFEMRMDSLILEINKLSKSIPELNIIGNVTSLEISDPIRGDENSIPYLIINLVDSESDLGTSFGIKLFKEIKSTEVVEYLLSTYELENDLADRNERAWKCTSQASCNGCKPVRGGFLGLGAVTHCDCSSGSGECSFEASSSGFPWAAVLSFAAGIIAALIGANN